MRIRLERGDKPSRYHLDVYRVLIVRGDTTYEITEDQHGSGIKVRIADGFSSQMLVQPEAANSIVVRASD